MSRTLLIGARPTFRLDRDLQKRVDAYMQKHGISEGSSALRLLVDKGLEASGVPAFGDATSPATTPEVREGIRVGRAQFMKAASEALHAASKGKP